MTIPMIVYTNEIVKAEALSSANIKDIAPTVTKLLGVDPDEE